MGDFSAVKLFESFLSATSPNEVQAILRQLGDYSDVGLDQPFGDDRLAWHPFGNNPSNISTIGLATKAGRSLTERVTNATDALLEARAPVTVSQPPSPRAAAMQWFGRPISGPEDGLFQWDYRQEGYDRLIHVVLQESGVPSAPTVDVLDRGIGVKPEDFPSTILSLQGGNKISKFFLLGVFGQGGASSLAFCDYCLIVSRHKDNPARVGFTLIRVLNLNTTYREDAYAYLCRLGPDGKPQVLNFETSADSLMLYSQRQGVRAPTLEKGTLVRHYAFKLPKLDGALGPDAGNLYHFLHVSLFDPLLPFRLVDFRDEARPKDEIIGGSRNRLMRLAVSKDSAKAKDESGSEIRHHRTMEYFTPHGVDDAAIGIEYWVVFNYRKRKGTDERILRAQSNALYIQAGHPIVGTLNGQNQGEMTGQLLRQLGLTMVSRHIVIHVDASRANSRVRRELFSTSREGFKEGDMLRDLTTVLEKMLREDTELGAIERELTERLARRDAEDASEEVKRQVAGLLLEAGLQVKDQGPALVLGEEEEKPVAPIKPSRPLKPDPLPTLPFPQVTKFEIVSPTNPAQVRQNDSVTILVETDADSEFDRQNRIAIRSEPPHLEQFTKAPLRGGRLRWRLRPTEGTSPGATGKIVVTLTKPDGTQLSSEVGFEVLPPLEAKSKKQKGYIPPFRIIAINPEDHPADWATAWPDLAEGVPVEGQSAVAYKAVQVSGETRVYYSTIFTPFSLQLDALKTKSAALSEFFRTSYAVWIGYHAILQEHSHHAERGDLDEEVVEQMLEADRVRVAIMQVKQARETALLKQKLSVASQAEAVAV